MSVLVVAGPTGVGKTETAIRVAEVIDGEIVGCDALQVYRGFDRGTAKPTPEQLARIPHHLIDVADPRRDFSLADYVRLAEESIAGIASRGRVPIVVGGTGLYLRGLLRGIVPAPARDEALRARIRSMGERYGLERLHRWLAVLDPASASRLAPRDAQRVTRAIEVALSGRRTWSERIAREGTWATGRERVDALKVVLDVRREALVARIDRRVDRFFESGLVDEVQRLVREGVPEHANAFKAIGYREVLAAIRAGDDPDAVRETVRVRTRRYAKRQRTWLRSEPGAVWLDAEAGPDRVASRIVDLWQSRRS